MPSNNELIAENKTLKSQVAQLESQLKADVIAKSEYDAVKAKLDAAEKRLADGSFPTLQKDVESLTKKLETAIQERDQARGEVIEAGNTIRNLQATQRVEEVSSESPRHADLTIHPGELRQLTALCLSKATDDLGRVIPEKQLDREVPKLVSTAIYIAKEIAAQIP